MARSPDDAPARST